jgi:long-chain acyl-CoA synthetase
MTNFATELTTAAAEAGDRPAVKLDDVVLNYGLLDAAAQRAAGMLRGKGVGPGDTVGMQMPNVPYFPIVYFGALRLGAVVVPMNPLLKGREVEYYLSDSGSKVMVAWHDFAAPAQEGSEAAGAECVVAKPGEFEQLLAGSDAVEEVVERADDDDAVIIYTSGTTGTPKGATLMHSNIAVGARVARDLVDLGPDGVGLATLPLFHVFGMTSVMNVCLVARGLLTLLPRFEPGKALEIIERDHVTSFAGVPTMYTALLHHPDREKYDVSSLDLCVSGGSAMPVELLHGFDDAFGAKVLEGYGLSETTGMGSFNLPDRERKAGSIGVPVGGTEFRLADDDGKDVAAGERGEIVMRGPFVMKGYWNKPEATADTIRDGWFHTGDIGQVDDDGYYFIVDRKKELVIRGGYNVYPREIEEVLYSHPAVREAAVLGVPHDELGEEVAAAVSLKDGAEATPEEIRDYVKQRVAAYKYPRKVWIADDLPKTSTGKILKREIAIPEEVAIRARPAGA